MEKRPFSYRNPSGARLFKDDSLKSSNPGFQTLPSAI